jgi:hypothetical protein
MGKKYEIIVGSVVGFVAINGFGCSQNSHVFVAIGGFRKIWFKIHTYLLPLVVSGKYGSYLLKFHTTRSASTLFDYGM